jgi:hypothetical protein
VQQKLCRILPQEQFCPGCWVWTLLNLGLESVDSAFIVYIPLVHTTVAIGWEHVPRKQNMTGKTAMCNNRCTTGVGARARPPYARTGVQQGWEHVPRKQNMTWKTAMCNNRCTTGVGACAAKTPLNGRARPACATTGAQQAWERVQRKHNMSGVVLRRTQLVLEWAGQGVVCSEV